jgi:hypothetical protein
MVFEADIIVVIKIDACLNLFHILDEVRHNVLKNIRYQAILIPMGKRSIFSIGIQLYIGFEHQHLF